MELYNARMRTTPAYASTTVHAPATACVAFVATHEQTCGEVLRIGQHLAQMNRSRSTSQ
jgi:hypothetical protein